MTTYDYHLFDAGISTPAVSGGTAIMSTSIAVVPPMPEHGIHSDIPPLPLDPFLLAFLAAACVCVAAKTRISLQHQRLVAVTPRGPLLA
jgi:hypothetical protein